MASLWLVREELKIQNVKKKTPHTYYSSLSSQPPMRTSEMNHRFGEVCRLLLMKIDLQLNKASHIIYFVELLDTYVCIDLNCIICLFLWCKTSMLVLYKIP